METLVRKLAADLAAAIRDARKAGYSVEWPSRPDDLERIAISETGRVANLRTVPGKSIEVIGFPYPIAVKPEPHPEELTVAPSDAPEPTPKKPRFKPSTEQ